MAHENIIYVVMIGIKEVQREVKVDKKAEFDKLMLKQKRSEEQKAKSRQKQKEWERKEKQQVEPKDIKEQLKHKLVAGSHKSKPAAVAKEAKPR